MYASFAQVYSVELPPEVRQLIDRFSFTVSFGISFASTPLECLGLGDYFDQLLIWLVSPLALVLPLGVAVRLGSGSHLRVAFSKHSSE